MQITKFRPVGRGGRRIAVFDIELPATKLRRLELTRRADGEIRAFGQDITRLLESIVQTALAEAEAQHDGQ